MISIGNIKTYRYDGTNLPIKVDRSSLLGNPFPMRVETDRNRVCDLYQQHFNELISSQKNYRFMKELDRIYELSKTKDIVLLCWCAPKRCHAETIKRYLEERLENETRS